MPHLRLSEFLRRNDEVSVVADHLFSEADTNHNGTLDHAKLLAEMRKLGLPCTPQAVDSLLTELGATALCPRVTKEMFLEFAGHRRQLLRESFLDVCSGGDGAALNNVATASHISHYVDGDVAPEALRAPDAASGPSDAVPGLSVAGGCRTVCATTDCMLAARSFTAAQLKQAAAKSGVVLTDSQAEDLTLRFRHGAGEADSTVTFNEFVRALLLAPCVNPRAHLDLWYHEGFVDMDTLSFSSVPGKLGPLSFAESLAMAHNRQRRLRQIFSPRTALEGSGAWSDDGFADAEQKAAVFPVMVVAPSTSSREEGADDDAFAAYTADQQQPLPAAVAPSTKAAFSHEALTMAWKRLLCGGLAGVLSRSLTAPIDRVRLIMMASATSETQLGMRAAIGQCMHGDVVHLVSNMPRRRGVLGFWVGNGTNCVKITPEMAIKLFSFDTLKGLVARDPEHITTVEHLIAGGLAGAVAELSVYPLDVARTRMAVSPNGKYRGLVHCMVSVKKAYGWRGLYAGVAASVAGIVPFAAIDLALNSRLRELAATKLLAEGREASVPIMLGCGMCSSAVAVIATFPLSVLRTNMQATGGSTMEVLRKMCTAGSFGGQGGVVGFVGLCRPFYRGVLPSLAKVMPATAISYSTYEYLKRRMG